MTKLDNMRANRALLQRIAEAKTKPKPGRFMFRGELNWSQGEQRLPEWMVERYGYEKARRIGVVAMVGGKDKTRIRNATPLPFRDVLLSIAKTSCKGPR